MLWSASGQCVGTMCHGLFLATMLCFDSCKYLLKPVRGQGSRVSRMCSKLYVHRLCPLWLFDSLETYAGF